MKIIAFLFLQLATACLFSGATSNVGNSNVTSLLMSIKELYTNPSQFDDKLVEQEQQLNLRLQRALIACAPDEIISMVDFDQPFEAFYLLGCCFSNQRSFRAAVDPGRPDMQIRLYAAIYDRLISDKEFRDGFVRYVAWSNVLRTEFRTTDDFHMSIPLINKFVATGLSTEDKSVEQKAALSIVYLVLFGHLDTNELKPMREERESNFSSLRRSREKLMQSLTHDSFEVVNGYLYRASVSNNGKMRTINVEFDDKLGWPDRIPNSITPLFPTEKLSLELRNFLDIHEINREFHFDL